MNKKTYPTPESLSKRVNAYFDDQNNRPYTGYGLQIYLGFNSHNTYRNYSKFKGYEGIIDQAFMRIAEQHEKNLITSKNCTGSIFWLKSNNFTKSERWIDTETNKIDGELKINVKISGNKTIDVSMI